MAVTRRIVNKTTCGIGLALFSSMGLCRLGSPVGNRCRVFVAGVSRRKLLQAAQFNRVFCRDPRSTNWFLVGNGGMVSWDYYRGP